MGIGSLLTVVSWSVKLVQGVRGATKKPQIQSRRSSNSIAEVDVIVEQGVGKATKRPPIHLTTKDYLSPSQTLLGALNLLN